MGSPQRGRRAAAMDTETRWSCEETRVGAARDGSMAAARRLPAAAIYGGAVDADTNGRLNLIGETQACGSDAPRRATPPWRRDRPFSRVLDTPHGALDTPVAVAHSVYTLWQQRWRFERGGWRLAKAQVLLARFERGLIRRRAEQAADDYPLIPSHFVSGPRSRIRTF